MKCDELFFKEGKLGLIQQESRGLFSKMEILL